MDEDHDTEDYHRRVRELFEDQGFTVTDHDDHLTASKDEQELAVLPLPDAGPGEIEEQLESAGKEDRTIVFTTAIPEDEKDRIEDETGADVSVFDPYSDENDIDTPDNMPSSYEIIGDIAIINMDEIPDNSDEIVEALLEQNPNVRTVLAKTGKLEGEFRVGDYTVLHGDGTETVHREHGCRYRVDPTDVYFSERLGHERERVTGKVEDGEHVAVWFAGVGPYAVLIATDHDATVDAIEKNPAGCRYMEDNIELNDVQDRVTAHCGDVSEIAPGLEAPDRIIMPLPGHADEFVDLAVETIASGGTIHYYRFSDEDDLWTDPVQELEDAAQRMGREITVLEKEICGHHSPYTYRICVDARVE